MALLVHIPLKNYTLENLGTQTISLYNRNNTPIYKNYAVFNQGVTNQWIASTDVTVGNTWSYGIWWSLNKDIGNAWQIPVCLNDNGSNADIQLGFWIKANMANTLESDCNGKYASSHGIENKLNKWYHVFATYDGSNLKTYVNGILQRTVSYTQAIVQRHNLTIGGHSSNTTNTSMSYATYGRMYDFRLYDEVLTDAQIQEIYLSTHPSTFEKGLQAWYPSIETLKNQSLLNTNLSSSNHTFADDSKIGPQCLDYNAKCSDTFSIPELYGSKQLTIAMWLKEGTEITSANSFLDPINCTIVNDQGTEELLKWEIFGTNNATLGCWVGSLGKTYRLGIDIAPNTWNHFCVVIDFTNSDFRQYKNGIKDTTITTPFDTTKSPSYYVKGTGIRINEAVANFHNSYNDIRIYNRALTDSEVKRLANARLAHYTLTDTCWNVDGTMCADSQGYNYKGSSDTSVRVNYSPKYAKANSFTTSTPRTAIQVPFNKMIGINTASKKDWSISMWFYKPTDIAGWNTLFGGPSGFELEGRVASSGVPDGHVWNEIYLYTWGGGRAQFSITDYNHLVFTQNNNETKLYLNGELKITGNSPNIPIGNYFIGAWRDKNSQMYTGKISDVRIYAKCLTAEEVLELYNNHKTVIFPS